MIPVIDLRLRFDLSETQYNQRTCIVVVEITGQKGKFSIGLVVDSVSEVVNIKAEEIEKPPSFGAKVQTDYILGMAKMNGSVKILLDIEKVLSSSEMTSLAAMN